MADNVLYFEDIKVGDEIPALVKPITSVGMVMYAAATWDFHRYHFDTEYVNSLGFSKPFLDGQQLAAFLAQQVVDWAGVDATLKRLGCRYSSFVVADDTLTCKGVVSGKSQERGEFLIECELWIENQLGERVLDRGRAIVSFPSRTATAGQPAHG